MRTFLVLALAALPHAAQAEDPPLSVDAFEAFVEGRLERRTWSPRPDLDVRRLAAIEALSRHGRARARM